MLLAKDAGTQQTQPGEEAIPMVPDDPKSVLLRQLCFQSGPLIPSHLAPFGVALKRPGSASAATACCT